MKIVFNSVPAKLLWLPLVFVLFSCTNTRKTTYFYGVPDGPVASNMTIPESIIQKNDILSIVVSDINPAAAEIFNPINRTNSDPSATGNKDTPVGYLVDSDGEIQFPVLGSIKAQGLTKTQLKQNIIKIILDKKLLLDPIVSIRFLNFRVTVLGEVGRPTVIPIPNEKISLLEALGLAGDLTIYGNRHNVMVIREEISSDRREKRTITRLDLNSAEIFTSPYYYLQSNDIVYVEPNKAKVASTSRASQWLPVVFSALSLAAIVADRLLN